MKKSVGLYWTIGVVLFALLMVACKKEPSDYRCVWVGCYDYNARISTWYPDHGTTQYQSGNLSVASASDSCVNIMLSDSTRYWLCKVSVDGNLTLVESNSAMREFEGCFPQSDSLYIDCANYGPGTGISWTYYCKKIE